jgi:N-acetylmuramoyl-L-alanine amidase
LKVREDLGTLILSDLPVAVTETGNMRTTGDARRMTPRADRRTTSRAAVRGIATFLGR